MSLMHLLAVGRSVIGLKSGRGPFKMSAQGALPKFGAEGAASASASSICSADGSDSGLENRKAAVAPAAAAALSARLPAIAQSGAPAARWRFSLRNPLAALMARRSLRAQLVQAELDLGTVKVVRNDLSDADLEVVAASRKAPAAAREIKSNPFAAYPKKPEAARELAGKAS